MLSGVKTGGRAQHTSGLQEAIHQAIWLIQTHSHVPQNKFLLQRARALPDPSHHSTERVSLALRQGPGDSEMADHYQQLSLAPKPP